MQGGRAAAVTAAAATRQSADRTPDVKRLTYLEKREWERMEQTILEAEEKLAACGRAVEDPAVASDPATLDARWKALEAARAEVERLYARWAELERKQT
jgi:ATP-binding cassette subfamily F protein uup